MRRPNGIRSEDPDERVSSDLLERCKKGDEQAWKELVQATHKEVYTLCLRILGDPHDAAEATQDAYLKAWRGLGRFRGDSLFTTWLYRVAANSAISKHRSRKRRRSHEMQAQDEALARIPSGASTESAAGARIDVGVLQEAMALLPEHYRSAVALRDIYGLGIAEIASRLGITETAAKVRVHRGRKMLREMVFPEESS